MFPWNPVDAEEDYIYRTEIALATTTPAVVYENFEFDGTTTGQVLSTVPTTENGITYQANRFHNGAYISEANDSELVYSLAISSAVLDEFYGSI